MKGSRENKPDQTGIESVKNLLGNKEFNKFLDGYEGNDEIDPSTPEGVAELQKRFELFEISKKAAPELKKLFRERIQEDIDIKLADSEMTEIDEYVERMTRENPEAVQVLMQEMAEFRTREASIAGKEQEIEEMIDAHGGKWTIDQKALNLDVARKKGAQRLPLVGRFFGSSDLQKKSRHTLAEQYGISERDINARRQEVHEVKRLTEQLGRYQDIRSRIFQDIGPANAVFEKARKRAQEQLKKLADPSKGMKEWEQALVYHEQLKQAGEHAPGDYLDGYEQQVGEGDSAETMNAEQAKGWLERQVDEKVSTIIRDALVNKQSFSEFDRAMKDVVSKERIGVRTGKEKSEFIRSALREQLEGASKSKRLFIKTFLATFEQGV